MKEDKKKIKEAKQKIVNKRGDIRDHFVNNEAVPFLAPKDFKPLAIH